MLKILVVDDEDIERDGIIFLLKKFQYNFEIIEAENGNQAYSYLQENHFDILFTDIRMPFIDGLELTKLAVKLYKDLKVIIFSGFHEFEYAKKALTLGVIDYILKPIDIDEFRKVIDSTLEKIDYQNKQLESKNQNDLFIRRYILLGYINGTSVKLLSQEFNSSYDLDFLNNYSKIFMLEFEHGFFENSGLLFDKEILPLLNFQYDYLNLNNSQSLLFIKKFTNSPNNYRETAKFLLNIIREKYNINCYISISNNIKSAEDILLEISSLENLLNNKFLLSDTYIFANDEIYENQPVVDRFALYSQQHTSSGSNAVELVKQYIANNYGSELSLEVLASHVYLTPRYLSYIFIQETGSGINKYIKSFRMQKAKELLENTNMKIASICKQVGYNNVSYFCQSFREFYGKSPEKYRKKE
ncbi:response regulator [Clostridium sp. C2-6-12]|uniref:response regulator transcription factor n=1 Tax=Clostridium sp. C2-6-12 TaxID=2698832 RepID=UPI00136996F5|nr:response regulator [Clostridium sp. C2-6-12]